MSTRLAHLPDWIYQQSAVLPYRHGANGLEVLLVTSRRGSRWVPPKGIVEPGLTAPESAAKEAREEAGVVGAVSANSLGRYRYKKWGGTCEVEVFPMAVTAATNSWPEAETRRREWMTVDEASQRVSKKKLRNIIRRLPEAVEANGAQAKGAAQLLRGASAIGQPRQLIYLFRHAKSSWDNPSLDDFDRPLAPRGERALEKMQQYMTLADVQPELVLCSSAQRTRQTYAGILAAVDEGVPVKFDRRLYLLGGRGLLNRLRRLPADIASVMLIAHNPGMQKLALSLVGRGDDKARQHMQEKFPTGALATLIWRGRKWAELGPGGCELHSFVVPRQL